MEKPKVLVTFDSMKDANCGYFSFGKGLGDALIQENKGKFELKFYLFKQTKYLFNGLVDIIYLSRLDRLFFKKKNDFEVVHLSDQTCRLRPKRVNAKKIMTIHDMNKVHLKFSRPHRIQAYLKKLGKLISQCDKIVCISQFVANDVKHYFPESANKISVIYNGADKLVSDENHQPAFKPGKKFLFTIGLLSVQKGFHLLPALLKDNDFELVISGRETPHKQRILEEAEKHNCLDRVHITGPISDEDKAWYYKNCDAFLFPSVAEGFGLPVIEAMHFGKPVFLSKFTSLPEVGGDVAYYFDNFEPEHMQEVFKKGMDDFAQNNRAKEAIAQAEKFSWEIAANQYLNLYQECLE
ncbi:glycosyltransferase family 4 protein [Pedobacter sp. ISL-68]|uniref:glycosyltransferase family 4 protein n=1 Tax=unclassified Pedobacter TaxID=2628915 RepID=UPI001BE99CCC|nr:MULTISPECIES: glycosyltransferase family 1 protein [unclassified Pedobacter]MBT2559671.1 glycosyltransferase family 4 protein [Pedobacter sp. ISL-64]MBT2591976.1 glycosyltransferase family 4 protein [Pedobacter sp. ISL-68]